MVIALIRLRQTLHTLRCFSTASVSTTQPSSSKTNPNFALFPLPRVTTPPFEFSRMVVTRFAELYYQQKEPEYSRESFLHGAMEAASLCAEYISNSNWDGLSHLCTKELVEVIRDRCYDLNMDQLRLTEEDVLASFLYSALFSGKKMHQFNPNTVHGYFTAVVFFRTTQSVPSDLSPKQYLNKHLRDLLVCNITLTRTIYPLGLWKVTTLNYFTPDG